MEEINLDLNNLFNLSYSFEGLKLLLTSIAKNQDKMIQKIKEIENNQKLNEKRNEKDGISIATAWRKYKKMKNDSETIK